MTSLRLFVGVSAVCLWGLQSVAAHAASEALCREYAQKAVRQYDEALALGAPNIGPPAWSNDYDAHYGWCLTAEEAWLTSEIQKREQTLAPYRSNQPQGTPQQQTPPPSSGGQSGTIVGPLLEADDACTRYAKEAVYHQQLNQQKQCGFTGPRWDSEQAYHENWCRRQSSLDPAMAEHKTRVDMLVACQTPATPGVPPKPPSEPKDPRAIEPLLVPGLTLAMWHGNCRRHYHDPDIPTTYENKYSLSLVALPVWANLRKLEKQGKTKNYSSVCLWDGFDADYDDPEQRAGLGFVTIKDIPANSDILRKLPPGLILGLRTRIYNTGEQSKVFGQEPQFYEQTVTPGPLPGVKTFCALDYTTANTPHKLGSRCERAWFETVNDVADVDWSLVERLPRYTVVGLKYESNNDGDWVGNQRWKRLTWIGPNGTGMKLYDPSCDDCSPPPGFVRVEAGDLNAPAGQGYVWFMKITGPDITQHPDIAR